MYKSYNYWEVILITSESLSHGILVESEGYDYARFSGYVPVSEVLNIIAEGV